MAEFELRCNTWLNDKEVLERVRAASQQRLAKAALIVEAEAKRSLNTGATKIRQRDEHGRFAGVEFTTESGPAGEPPRKRTGNLQNSIKAAKTETGTWVIGPATTAWYGRVHEFGALINVTPKMRGFLFHKFGWRVRVGVIHIPRRPFMKPALDNSVRKFADLFRDLPLGGSAQRGRP